MSPGSLNIGSSSDRSAKAEILVVLKQGVALWNTPPPFRNLLFFLSKPVFHPSLMKTVTLLQTTDPQSSVIIWDGARPQPGIMPNDYCRGHGMVAHIYLLFG